MARENCYKRPFDTCMLDACVYFHNLNSLRKLSLAAIRINHGLIQPLDFRKPGDLKNLQERIVLDVGRCCKLAEFAKTISLL